MISCLSVQGAKQVIGVYGGRLHLSTNNGSTWAEIQPAGDVNKNWQCVVLSANGLVIIAGIYGGRLYMSTDTGSTWSEIRPIDDADYNWVRVTASTDGSIIYASNEKRLWRSINSGSSWSEIQPVGNFDRNWQAICAAPSGTTLLVGDASPGKLWYSADTGATWIEVNSTGGAPLGDKAWQDINGDGSDLFNGYDDKRLYQGFRNWDPIVGPVDTIFFTELQPLGDVDKNWRIHAKSYNIDFLEAVFGGRLYYSMGGVDLLEIPAAGYVDKNWNCVYSGGFGYPGVACEGNNLYVTPDMMFPYNPWAKHHFGPDATLTVSSSETGGIPDGHCEPSYTGDTVDANELLPIVAVAEGAFIFDNWSIISGTPTITDVNAASTTVTLIPDDTVEIKMNFHEGPTTTTEAPTTTTTTEAPTTTTTEAPITTTRSPSPNMPVHASYNRSYDIQKSGRVSEALALKRIFEQ